MYSRNCLWYSFRLSLLKFPVVFSKTSTFSRSCWILQVTISSPSHSSSAQGIKAQLLKPLLVGLWYNYQLYKNYKIVAYELCGSPLYFIQAFSVFFYIASSTLGHNNYSRQGRIIMFCTVGQSNQKLSISICVKLLFVIPRNDIALFADFFCIVGCTEGLCRPIGLLRSPSPFQFFQYPYHSIL